MSICSRIKGTFAASGTGRGDSQVYLFRQLILAEWEKQPLVIMLHARLLCSLVTGNTTFSHDLTVYRGLVDTRHKRWRTSSRAEPDIPTYLKNLKKVRELEDFVKPRMSDETMLPVILHSLLTSGKDEIRLFHERPFISKEAEDEVLKYLDTLGIKIDDLVDNSIGLLEKLNVGDQYVCNTFMSTSLMKSHSQKFYEPGYCCFLEIFIPAHSPMLYISPFGNFTYHEETGEYNLQEDEFEILLAPGSRFTVKSNRHHYVRLYYEGCNPHKEDVTTLAKQWDIIIQAEEIKYDLMEQSYDSLVSLME